MNKKRDLIKNVIAWAIIVFFLFPIIWLFLTSIRPDSDLFSVTSIFTTKFTLEQYFIAFKKYNIMSYLNNSIFLCLGVVFFVMILGVPAAYVMSRARIKISGKPILMVVLFITRMLPVITLIIPLFIFMSKLKITDNIISLILSHTAFKLPMTIWLCMLSFYNIPVEMEESAELDGASNLKVFLSISVPMILPGLSVSAILAFILTWNDLLIGLVLTHSPSAQPITVGLSSFMTDYGIDWGPLSAVGILSLIPIMIFALISGEALITGLTSGSVKG